MLPNFLIIGASRCGTTWLAKNIKLHPQIYMPAKKELHFFDTDFDKGWGYYESFFPESKCSKFKAIGEATPAYLYTPQVPQLIKSRLPDVKMIVSLRNPIDRAYSHYWNLYAAAPEGHVNKRLCFEEKLDFTPRLIDEGFYDQKLSNYYEFFPKENILVVIFEEMIRDQQHHFQKIYDFLGVDSSIIPLLMDVRINSAASKLGRFKTLEFAYKAFYKLIRVPSISMRIDDLNAKKLPEMREETRENLRNRFAPNIANLEKMLSRELGIWHN